MSHWYIADNTIIGDNDPIEGGIGGEGIELNHSSGHTVCYNRISRTADGVSYPQRNCDIFGNDIFDVSDDGLEPDYGYANVRMWDNRITNAKNAALSFQPMYCGPWYFIRNQYVGDGSAFKFRVQDRFVLANNTFVRWGEMDWRMQLMLSALSRNNLFISVSKARPVWTAYYNREDQQQRYVLLRDFRPDWRTDVDYDGFDWSEAPVAFRWGGADPRAGSHNYKNLTDFAAAIGIEKHGRHVRKEAIFENWNIPSEPGRIDPNIVLRLKAGCNAIDAGSALHNINDGYTGKAPDLGAHELGKRPAHYGPRKK